MCKVCHAIGRRPGELFFPVRASSILRPSVFVRPSVVVRPSSSVSPCPLFDVHLSVGMKVSRGDTCYVFQFVAVRTEHTDMSTRIAHSWSRLFDGSLFVAPVWAP